jgi:hypothetical protein
MGRHGPPGTPHGTRRAPWTRLFGRILFHAYLGAATVTFIPAILAAFPSSPKEQLARRDSPMPRRATLASHYPGAPHACPCGLSDLGKSRTTWRWAELLPQQFLAGDIG